MDFTIADFVADARAPTPSAAAELVVPDRLACLEALERTAQRLAGGMRREVRRVATRLEATERRLTQAHPGVRLQQQMQRLDDLGQRLTGAVRASVHRDRLRVAELKTRLARRSPQHAVQEYRARHQQLQNRLTRALEQGLARVGHRLALAQRGLNTVSPLATLTRGFAIVTRADGSVLTDTVAVAPGDQIEARLARGTLSARVTGSK